MGKKLLFFDIDGTLILEDGSRRIPESAREGIAAARAKGNLAFINTGRVRINVEQEILDIGFDGMVCGCGTQIFYHGEELFRHRLPREVCLDTAMALRRCGATVIYEAADLNGYDPEAPRRKGMDELMQYFRMKNRKIVTVEDPEFYFDKLYGWVPEGEAFHQLQKEIEGTYDYIPRGDEEEGCFAWEIVPKGCTKATGIRFLMDHFHVPLEDCYVFGDSFNDLPMLEYVPHSVAMGGCPKELAELVEYVTDRVEDDGLYHALCHYDLI